MERVNSLSSLERIPPQSIEAEQSTLGSMMLDSKAIDRAEKLLTERSFYRPSHGEIYAAMVTLRHRDEPVDLITLQEELRSRGKLDEVGGTEYLMALLSQVPSAAHIEHYAAIVDEKAVLRQLIDIGTQAIALAYDPESTAAGAIQRLTDLALEVRAWRTTGRMRHLREIVDECMEEFGNRLDGGGLKPVHRFGIDLIDKWTLGVPIGFSIICARPSHGKTSALMEIIRASKAGPWLVFSPDNEDLALGNRLITGQAEVDLYKFRGGSLDEDGVQRALMAQYDLSKLDVIVRSGDLSISEFISETKSAILEYNIAGVLIDYAQLIDGPGESEVIRLKRVSQRIKTLSKGEGIRIVAAVQLNRLADESEGFNPKMIEGSDQFWKDADVCVVVKNKPPENGSSEERICRWILAKQKDGGTGITDVWWNPSTLRFNSMENRRED